MASIEYEILLAAGHVDPDDDQQTRLAGLMAGEFDQEHLIRLARKEGMSGLLYKSLKKAGILGFLGHQQMRQLQSFYYRSVQHNLKVVQDLKEILRHSNQNEVQVVLLQGIALMDRVYKDIGLRPLTDIDLWVLPEKRAVFDSLLERLGYQRDPVYPSTFKNGPTIIDINSHILWADRIKSREHLLNRGQHTIHDNIDVFIFEGQPAGCLNAVDQVFYLSLHAFKHNVSRLIWLVDVKKLLAGWQASDWKALFDRAAEMGQINMVYDMLYLLARLFHLKPPPDIETKTAGHGITWLERVILKRRVDGRPLPNWAPLLLFTVGKDLKTRASFVFESLFPRPSVLRQIFSDRPNFRTWQLYIKRALQLFRMVRSSKSA